MGHGTVVVTDPQIGGASLREVPGRGDGRWSDRTSAWLRDVELPRWGYLYVPEQAPDGWDVAVAGIVRSSREGFVQLSVALLPPGPFTEALEVVTFGPGPERHAGAVAVNVLAAGAEVRPRTVRTLRELGQEIDAGPLVVDGRERAARWISRADRWLVHASDASASVVVGDRLPVPSGLQLRTTTDLGPMVEANTRRMGDLRR